MTRRALAALLLGGLMAAGPLAGCTGEAKRTPLPASPPAGAEAEASRVPVPSPSRAPAANTDGCQGLITAAQVQSATGLAVQLGQGDGAAAAAQYGQAAESLGLQARARLCPFNNAGGDQVTVVALTFADAGQAQKLWATIKSLEATGGAGDAALTDKSRTMLAKRGKAIVAVYLVNAKAPEADHLGQLRSVANAALAKA